MDLLLLRTTKGDLIYSNYIEIIIKKHLDIWQDNCITMQLGLLGTTAIDVMGKIVLNCLTEFTNNATENSDVLDGIDYTYDEYGDLYAYIGEKRLSKVVS